MIDTVELQFIASIVKDESQAHWLRAIPEDYFRNPTARKLRDKIINGIPLELKEIKYLNTQKVEYTPEIYARTIINEGYLRQAEKFVIALDEEIKSQNPDKVQQIISTPPMRPSLEPPLTAAERLLAEGLNSVEYAYPLPNALSSLQTYWGRLLPGAIHVIAADNGVGKSLLLEQIALGLALQDIPVADYSVEMPFIPRILRYNQHVFGTKIRVNDFYEKWVNKQINSDDLKALVRPFHDKPLYIQTINHTQDLLAHAEQLYHSRKVRVFVVDFLQALQGPKDMSKYEAIAYSITQIFNFSKRYPSTWLLASTYNREGKNAQRVDKNGKRQMPANQDLLGANEIETYAWTITHILKDDDVSSTRRFYMSKNRFGIPGDFQMNFDMLTLTFRSNNAETN